MVAAVALAPVAGAGVMTLTLLLMFAVAFGLKVAYDGTLGKIAVAAAERIDDIAPTILGRTVPGFHELADAIMAVHEAISEALGELVRRAEAGVAYFWDFIADTFDYMGAQIAGLAESTAGAVTTITRQVVPRAMREAVQEASRRTTALARDLAHLTTVALPGIRADVGALGGKLSDLTGRLRDIRDRVRAHDRLLTGVGITGLVMIALRRMGLGFLRCGNLRKTGRRLCGLDPQLLDALLVMPLVLAGAISVERLTRELLDDADVVEAALRKGFTELRGL
jgi:hypothetical protein